MLVRYEAVTLNPMKLRQLSTVLNCLIWTLLPLIIGLVVTGFAMGPIFKILPHDLMRVNTILRALDNDNHEPQGVLFGNSVAMNGFDTRRLGELLSDGGEILNLSSTGQTLPESLLYYQELPSSVTRIIQVVMPMTLEKQQKLREDTYNAFYFYGYRPESAMSEMIRGSAGEAAYELLNRSNIWHRFHGRWVLRQWIDTGVRSFLRTDLNLGRARNDLYYPAPYTRRIPPQKTARLLELWKEPREDERLRVSPSARNTLRMMADYAARTDREFYLVVAPMHPELREHFGERFFRDIGELRRYLGLVSSDGIIDATALLQESQFIDHAHPTAEGARLLEAMVASSIEDGA